MHRSRLSLLLLCGLTLVSLPSVSLAKAKVVTQYRFWQIPLFSYGLKSYGTTDVLGQLNLTGDLKTGNLVQFTGGEAANGNIPTVDFNQGLSKIYDDGQLRVTTDDYIYLNAPIRTFVSNDLQVGKQLVLANTNENKDTGSYLTDDGSFRIITDEDLYLDAPGVTTVKGSLATIGNLSTLGSASVAGNIALSGNLVGSGNVAIATDALSVNASSKRVGIGTASPGGKLHIAGSADTAQLIVQANGTQTANLQEWQNSSGRAITKVDPSGYVRATGFSSASNYGSIRMTDAESPINGINIVGGYSGNHIDGGYANVIAGGGNGVTIGVQNGADYGTALNEITGSDNTTTYITIAGGYDNAIGANIASTISGGGHNTVSGLSDHGTIAGGSYNTVGAVTTNTGHYDTISGGTVNHITSSNTSNIAGGDTNTISSATASMIGGGASHSVTGSYAGIASGISGTVAARLSFIGGGSTNIINSSASSDAANGGYAVIGGGNTNTITNDLSWIGGGSSNTISGINSGIGSALSSTISGNYSFVGGGASNQITGNNGVVGGGSTNKIFNATSAVISGGFTNTLGTAAQAYGDYATIAGGNTNFLGAAVSSGSTLSSGLTYTAASSRFSFIGAGRENVVENEYSAIIGGRINVVQGGNSVVLGGNANKITVTNSSSYDAIVAGNAHTISATGANNVIVGGESAVISGSSVKDVVVLGGCQVKPSATGIVAAADTTCSDFSVTTANQFAGRFANGYWLTGGGVAIGTSSAPTSSSAALEVNGGVKLNTATAQPTCTSSTRGTFWVVQNSTGVKDTVEVCAKDAGDAYAWRTIY